MDSQNVLENVFLADVSSLQSFIRNNLIYLFSVNYSLSERKHKVWVTQRLNSSQCWEGFCILVSLTWKMTCLQRISLCIFGHPTWPEWPTFLFLWLEELVFLDLCLTRAGALDPVFDSEVPCTMHYSPPSMQPQTEQENVICHFVVVICTSYAISCSPWLIFIMWY